MEGEIGNIIAGILGALLVFALLVRIRGGLPFRLRSMRRRKITTYEKQVLESRVIYYKHLTPI